jgi:hypothetical protein
MDQLAIRGHGKQWMLVEMQIIASKPLLFLLHLLLLLHLVVLQLSAAVVMYSSAHQQEIPIPGVQAALLLNVSLLLRQDYMLLMLRMEMVVRVQLLSMFQ